MDDNNKKRAKALELLAKKSRGRAKKTLANQDIKKTVDEKIAIDQKVDNIVNAGKSDEDLEKEAYNRYYKERLKKGLITKSFEEFKK